MPDAAVYLWRLFLDLHASREYTMGGPLGISYQELAAFSAVRRQHLDRFTVDAIRTLDSAYLEVAREE